MLNDDLVFACWIDVGNGDIGAKVVDPCFFLSHGCSGTWVLGSIAACFFIFALYVFSLWGLCFVLFYLHKSKH